VLFFLSKKIPVVSGSTGWDVAPAVRMAREQQTPFLHSPNFSIGVAVMRRLAARAAELLAPFPGFEPGILERHHSAKKDAPSGTAKLLAAAAESARPGAAVPVVALRQGGQPGEHVLYFEGADETLEIVHRARSRAIFAAGAVAAAEWLLSSGRSGPATFDEFLDAFSTERTAR
jgi:4-hydroxy-tetrahydrodipicolinate reductase